jgi:hypothetical protein
MCVTTVFEVSVECFIVNQPKALVGIVGHDGQHSRATEGLYEGRKYKEVGRKGKRKISCPRGWLIQYCHLRGRNRIKTKKDNFTSNYERAEG